MKIILVISKFFPEYTGPSVRMLRLYNFLKKKNVDLEIICGGLEYKYEKFYEINGFKVHRLKNLENQRDNKIIRIIKNYIEFFKLWKILKKKKFDLLHIIGQTNLTASAITYASLYKVPMMIELVTKGSHPKRTLPILNRIWLPKLKKFTVVIAISKFLKQKCLDEGLKDNIWYRPNPVDTKKFNVDLSYKNRNRKKISNFDNEDILICSIAKFMPQKNQIFLIEVLKNLPKKYKLILAGPKIKGGNLFFRDKNYLQKIKKLIIQYNLQNRVLLIEKFVDAEKYIKISDIYALPAYNEGLGTPLLESLSCGVPVIANIKEIAFREWIKNKHNGYLVELDKFKWCKAIKNLNLNKKSVIESSIKIKKIASEKFIFEKYLNILTSLITSKSFNKQIKVNI